MKKIIMGTLLLCSTSVLAAELNINVYSVTEVKVSENAVLGSSEYSAQLKNKNIVNFGIYCYPENHSIATIHHSKDNSSMYAIYSDISFEECKKIIDSSNSVSVSNPILIVVENPGEENQQKILKVQF